MSPEAYIGIDLGGTNVRAGLVAPDGTLLTWRDELIEAHLGPQVGVQRIITLIDAVIRDAGVHPRGIGIGATGPVDHQRGAIQNPYTLPTWEDVDIVTPLKTAFGVPVLLENDADAAALGEYWLGAGRGISRLMMVTVGTGIGTAFILDGKIYRGAGGGHPEGGHIPIDPHGPVCYCGANGCWEALASGNAIGLYARSQPADVSAVLLQKAGDDPEKIDAALVSEAARAGDPLALAVVERTATYLALGLVNLLHLFLPDCVVFTGGVMRSMDLFEPRLHEVIKQHSIMNPIDHIPLRMAQLGQQAGIIGAAKAAMNEAG